MPINYKKCATEQEKIACKQLVDKFFIYYVHNNLYYYENNKEFQFCDALVIFEDYNLIFEMKSIKNQNINSYNKNLKKGVKQLNRSYEKMKNIESLKLFIGKRNNKKEFNQKFGTKTFYILLMDGMSDFYKDQENFINNGNKDSNFDYLMLSKAPDNLEKDKLNNEYFIYNSKEEFENTLKYCSTIEDFIKFLEFTKDIIYNRKEGNKLCILNEYGLLHLYVRNNRKLISDIKEEDFVIIADDCDLSHPDMASLIKNEEESYKMIDEDLINFSMNQKNDEYIIKDFVKLNRKCRIGLVNAINQKKGTGIIIRDDSQDIIYVVDYQYDSFKKLDNAITLENYVNNILRPILIYRELNNINFKSMSILLYHSSNGFKNRALIKINGEQTKDDYEHGKKVHELLKYS